MGAADDSESLPLILTAVAKEPFRPNPVTGGTGHATMTVVYPCWIRAERYGSTFQQVVPPGFTAVLAAGELPRPIAERFDGFNNFRGVRPSEQLGQKLQLPLTRNMGSNLPGFFHSLADRILQGYRREPGLAESDQFRGKGFQLLCVSFSLAFADELRFFANFFLASGHGAFQYVNKGEMFLCLINPW